MVGSKSFYLILINLLARNYNKNAIAAYSKSFISPKLLNNSTLELIKLSTLCSCSEWVLAYKLCHLFKTHSLIHPHFPNTHPPTYPNTPSPYLVTYMQTSLTHPQTHQLHTTITTILPSPTHTNDTKSLPWKTNVLFQNSLSPIHSVHAFEKALSWIEWIKKMTDFKESILYLYRFFNLLTNFLSPVP